jgi:membrane protease YdiL (CAAX protease family)
VRSDQRDLAVLVAIIVLLTVFNVSRSALIPSGAHFVANVALGLAVLGIGLAAGMTGAEIGASHEHLGAGLRLGAIVAAVIAFGVVFVAVVPFTSDLFDDARTRISLPEMLVRVILVIPVATVLVEELVFRGVVLGLLRRRHHVVGAAVWSAVLFGLWHLFPVWWSYDDVAVFDLSRLGAVAGTFVATFAAGLGFAWLRVRADHLAAPMLVHVATNSVPFAVAWAVSS